MVLDESKIPADVVERARQAAVEKRIADEALSQAIVEVSPYKTGDLIRDKNSGNIYRVEDGHGYFRNGRCCINIWVRRTYKTGRADAMSRDLVSNLGNYELYKGEKQ